MNDIIIEKSETNILPSVDEATEKLTGFFAKNPYSTVTELESRAGFEILKPWGDTSLSIIIIEDFEATAEALNAIKLPERFSAIWHEDVRKIEIVWTAFKLPSSQKEIDGRKFTFSHKGCEHKCEFGKSSERLLALAKVVQPLTISETNHRNMNSLAAFVEEDGGAGHMLDYPRSFWIDNISWDEAVVVDTINHLNFYMRYYDGLSPTVLIHPANNETVVPKKTRYVSETFPAHVESSVVDENLLSFWSFADTGNPMLRFLLYYRILEYAAVHLIDDSIRCELKKLILTPDLKHDLGRSIEKMVGAMSSSKLSDAQRLRALARASISPKLLWRDLDANKDFFIKDTVFEGGFVIRSPIVKNDSSETFGVSGVERLSDRFRDIRNALSHGKDQEKGGVIRPTNGNGKLLAPWVHLIATAAGEVVLFKDAN
jgi:hypothetical protein